MSQYTQHMKQVKFVISLQNNKLVAEKMCDKKLFMLIRESGVITTECRRDGLCWDQLIQE